MRASATQGRSTWNTRPHVLSPDAQVEFPEPLAEITVQRTTSEYERRIEADERRADDALSDWGSDAMRRRWAFDGDS